MSASPRKATLSGAPGNRTPIFCMQNRCLPVGRAPHFIFFFSTPPRIRTLTYWVGTSSATVTPRAFSHQFFVFFCPNLTLFAIQNFSGNARNRTSRQLPHNLRQEGYNLPCGNAPPRISQAPALTRRVTISSVQRKPWDSNPQRFYPQLFSKQCPHPAG